MHVQISFVYYYCCSLLLLLLLFAWLVLCGVLKTQNVYCANGNHHHHITITISNKQINKSVSMVGRSHQIENDLLVNFLK